MTRFKAFALHLAASVSIALLVGVLVFGVWYPVPLQRALGVTDIFVLLLVVDAGLGPLLTLCIYRVGKSSLRFDLSVIALLQLSALIYGLWTVAHGRPAWLVFNVDRFDVVQAMDVDERGLERARLEYRHIPLMGPRWVGAKVPDDPQQRREVLFESVQGGSDIAQRPDLYSPLDTMIESIALRALPLDSLNKFNDADQVSQSLDDWPRAVAWVPLMARTQSMVVLLDKKYQVLGIAPLNPWK